MKGKIGHKLGEEVRKRLREGLRRGKSIRLSEVYSLLIKIMVVFLKYIFIFFLNKQCI